MSQPNSGRNITVYLSLLSNTTQHKNTPSTHKRNDLDSIRLTIIKCLHFDLPLHFISVNERSNDIVVRYTAESYRITAAELGAEGCQRKG